MSSPGSVMEKRKEGRNEKREESERGRTFLHPSLSCGFKLAQITVTLFFCHVGLGKRHPIIPSSLVTSYHFGCQAGFLSAS